MSSVGMSTGWQAEAPEAQGNALLIVHRLLRGRYLITIAMAGVLAGCGAVAGYVTQTERYRSNAFVQIQPVMPKILFETEQSTAPQMFASYVALQSELMGSESVVQNALDSDRWRAVSARTEIRAVDEFRTGLQIRTDRASQQLIRVEYEHEDPLVAQAGTQAVVDAYMERYGESSELGSEARIGVLETRRRTLSEEKNRIDAQIQDIASKHGTDQLGLQVQAAFETVSGFAEEKRRIETQIEDLRSLAAGEDLDRGLTPEQAAEFDPAVAEMLAIRRDLLNRRTSMIAGGILQGHRDYRQNEAGIVQVDLQIDERIDMIEQSVAGGGDGAGPATISGLAARLERIEQRLAEAQQTQTDLGRDNLRLRDLNGRRTDIDRQIQSTDQRLDAIRTESKVESMSGVSGRISVAGPATLPRTPSSDRRIKMAAAGFVVGGGAPVALMLGLGLISRRVRYSDDSILDAANSRVIGVLPDLGKSITDREMAAASAFAVHQIRSQLQILFGRERSTVFGVTSPAPGDGKTSMIIALGLSYAESGDRTLLIDLDLIGRGLSLHFGHPSAPSLAECAAHPEELLEQICESRFERLSILPAGMNDDQKISRLSPTVIRGVIEACRGHYDVILIDTGPILGSIEAGLIAPNVDGMMLVVGRNQLRPLVKRAVDHISAVGGQVVATVFNRASMQELRQSSSSMSVHFSRQASRQAAEQAASGRSSVGPLGGSLFLGNSGQKADAMQNGSAAKSRREEPADSGATP